MAGNPSGIALSESAGALTVSDSSQRLLDGLDDEQRAAVSSRATTLCVCAGPGSGKTRVLTHRIAYRAAVGGLDPRFAVAVTFTRRAAVELSERLERLGLRDMPVVGTFHALSSRMIASWAEDERRKPPKILPNRAQMLRKVLRSGESIHKAAEELDWAAANNLGASGYQPAAAAAGRNPGFPLWRMAEIISDFGTEKRFLRVCDFNDLLRMAAERLEQDDNLADAYRWGHRHFFVDEFQDLTPAQFRLLRAQLGGRADLCAVGDPDQAIYGWNGADETLLADFASNFEDAQVLRLDTNYRSSAGVVAVSQAIRPSGQSARAAPQNLGDLPEDALSIRRLNDDDAERQAIVEAIQAERLPGEHWSAQAVLVRTKSLVDQTAEALSRAGIPAVAVAGESRWAEGPPPSGQEDAVCVSTMHAAKGREFAVVHVAGLEEGLMPHYLSMDGAALSEEKRLFYVALTRARRKLSLTWAANRSGARHGGRRPSRWLMDLSRTMEASTARRGKIPARIEAAPGAAAPRPRLSASPLNGRALNGERRDLALIRNLMEWRRRQANAARVPPQAVIGDADLHSVASQRPSTLSELELLTSLGEPRIRNFGSRILKIVSEHGGASEDEATRL